MCVTKVYFLHFIKWQKFNSLCDPWWVLAVKSVPVMKQSWDPTVSKNILAGWFHLLIDMRKKYYCLSENLELVSIPPISGFVLDEKLQNFLFFFFNFVLNECPGLPYRHSMKWKMEKATLGFSIKSMANYKVFHLNLSLSKNSEIRSSELGKQSLL